MACRTLCDLCPVDPNLSPGSYSRLRLLDCGHISCLAVTGLTRQSPHLRAFALTVTSAPKATCRRACGCPSHPLGFIHTAPLLILRSRPGTFCFPVFLRQHTALSGKSNRQSVRPSSPVCLLPLERKLHRVRELGFVHRLLEGPQAPRTLI